MADDEHGQRSQRTQQSHGGLDGHRSDRLGRKRSHHLRRSLLCSTLDTSYANTNGHLHTDSYPYRYTYGNSDSNTYGNSDGNSDGNTYGNSDSNTHGDSNPNAHTYSNPKSEPESDDQGD